MSRFGLKESYKGNPVVKSFLEQKHHRKLFEQAINEPSEENRERLDQEFKQFYTEVRLIKYLSVMLHNTATHFDKKNRLQHKRFPLTLDKPLKKEENHTLLDSIASEQIYKKFLTFNKYTSLEDYVDDPSLYAALECLTLKEKEVLKFVFVFDMKVTDIAKKMKVSHQTISKTKHKALTKLREYLLSAREREAL